jgi:hypothetical protein
MYEHIAAFVAIEMRRQRCCPQIMSVKEVSDDVPRTVQISHFNISQPATGQKYTKKLLLIIN